MNKKVILTIVSIAAIACILVAIFIFALQPKTVRFIGRINAEEINCTIDDLPAVIHVDGKKIMLDPGNVAPRPDIGSMSEDLWVCNNFDLSSIETGKFGIAKPDQPDGGENIIGRKVEVYAGYTEDGSLTLSGDTRYYVKTVE